MATFDTPEAVAKLAEPDPEFAEFIANNKQPDIEFSYPLIQVIRQQTLAAEQKRSDEAIEAGRHEEVRKITMRDGHESEVRIHRPSSPPSSGSPLIVLIHGGGWIFGNAMQFGSTARILIDLYGATVVSISYRLAPEQPWPKGHEDAWDSLVWIAANAEALGADPKAGFIVGGASAGGNMAAVLAQRSLQDKLAVPITGIWLSVFMIFKDASHVPEQYKHLYLSAEQNADAPGLLNKSALAYIRASVKADGHSPMFSPINAEKPHEGMPPAFIQAAGMDVVRDDALIYERMLREHGVTTRLKVYPGVPHGHSTLYPQLKSSKEANADSIEGIGWLLDKKSKREDIEHALGQKS
ncbi:Alpha/beta hydrolase fold-containing protein 11 [Elsinoe fawcettii]|nr:Alpha/beta hydrolase fold-containing protein 11 [Elsinoe fawcettii]